MLEDRKIDELVARITVVNLFPDECGLEELPFNGKGKIVGRRKAMKFVFSHLQSGGVCVTKQLMTEGKHVTLIDCWTTKEKE